MEIVAIANQKGGVGKTTTAVNLATAFAAVGEPVLLIDLDPQGNASTGLGVPQSARQISSYDILLQPEIVSQAIIPTIVPKLDIIASTMDLLGAEVFLASEHDKTHKLTESLSLLKNDPNVECYRYIFVDCPPSLNLLTINALTAADSLIVPMQCEFFALEGLSQLLLTVEQVRESLNHKLRIKGVVLTMCDPRNRLSQQVADDVRHHLQERVYDTIIPRNVRVSEAPSYGKPVLIYDQRCAGAQAYIRLAIEIIQKDTNLKADITTRAIKKEQKERESDHDDITITSMSHDNNKETVL